MIALLLLLADVYHVSPEGNDANDGRSPTKAWKTIAKVNATAFEPVVVIEPAGPRPEFPLSGDGTGGPSGRSDGEGLGEAGWDGARDDPCDADAGALG